ncbi:MAG: tRNA (N6-threonylcarbamoyladenosine(37)-N6)-methyltransferase TrmO [Candidatus Lokiarchaeota archaeon]|nr:tRNA (N6-threonylcarbamoyladenosine(37)-N6)-methyltransferase TrmO [Candidatus Lokiarchaeota archaeon]
MKNIIYQAIGIIHSPFKEPKNTPIQPIASRGTKGMVEIFPDYVEGLKDLDGFSHIILIYHFHLARPYSLLVKPFLDDQDRGLFATRAPSRPNPIGISIVRLIKIEENILYVRDLDVIEGTPLLDLKPHAPEFFGTDKIKIGWLTDKINKIAKEKDNGRFTT